MSQLYQAIGLSVLPSVWPVVYGVLDGAVFKLNKDKKQWSEVGLLFNKHFLYSY